MRPRDRWPNATPELPQYPCLFVFSHVQGPFPFEDVSSCENCGYPLSRTKGGFVMVVFGPLSVAFCSSCLIAIAQEIRRRKETNATN